MMYVVMPCEGLETLRSRLSRHGKYLAEVEHREDELCHVSITLASYWETEYEYLSKDAEEKGDYSPQLALQLLAHLSDVGILMAIATRAPTTSGVGDSLYKHSDWVWIRDGYVPRGKAELILLYLLTDVVEPLDILYIDMPKPEGQKIYNGTIIYINKTNGKTKQ